MESGLSSIELPRNYFLVFDVRKTTFTLVTYLAKNLAYDALQIYGNGSFQIWEIEGSLCFRLYSTETQLSEYVRKCKESMKIWGIKEPRITVYASGNPQTA